MVWDESASIVSLHMELVHFWYGDAAGSDKDEKTSLEQHRSESNPRIVWATSSTSSKSVKTTVALLENVQGKWNVSQTFLLPAHW